MSYNSLSQQVIDKPFNDRIIAAAQKEAHNNAALSETDFGAAVRAGLHVTPYFVWPTALATEAQYEYAVIAGNQNPGGDPTVITDADILSAVQANWPADPWPAPAPEPV